MDFKIEKPVHQWSSDRELDNLEDDKLGRGEFAKRIAKELQGWNHNQGSLVMSLNGDWGSGKSSFKNFIIRCMEAESKNNGMTPIPIVSYNPWQWSGQDKLLQGFFDEVGKAFKTGKLRNFLKAWKLARAWEGLKAITIASREVATHLQRSLATISTLIAGGGSGLLALNFDSVWLSTIFATLSLILIGFATLCAIYAPVADLVAAVINWKFRSGEQSLENTRANLKRQLLKLERPVLVVIDDLDRLTIDEILLVVQLVKANADFPNVAYLLLFQRSRVAKALQEVFKENGYKYLQKVIQVELDIPSPPEDRLRKMLLDGLDIIHARAKFRWNAEAKQRWRNTFEDGIWPYFDTPRDVKRFLGVFGFYFESHITDEILEVSFTDLVGLEVLRMFDHEAYDGVRFAFQSKRRIYLQLLFGEKEFQEEFQLGVKELLERTTLSSVQKRALSALLYELFPQGSDNVSMDEQTWDRDNRICHPKHFPKYFQLTPIEGDISESTLRRLIEARNSISSSKDILLEVAQEDALLRLFERLLSVKDELTESTIRTLLHALFDISDMLPSIKNGVEFRADAERELARLSVQLLRGIEDPQTRSAILKEAIENTAAITGPAICVSMLVSSSKKEFDTQSRIIDLNTLEEVRDSVAKRLWICAQGDSFWNLHAVAFLIYRIKDWMPENELKGWLAKALAEPKHALVFIEHMVNESSSTNSRYGTRRVYKIPVRAWSDMVDIKMLYNSISQENLVGVNQKIVEKLGEILDSKDLNSKLQEIYVISRDEEGNLFEDPSDQF